MKVWCRGRAEDGTKFAIGEETDPVEFTLGGGQVDEWLESAVEGMRPGQSITVPVYGGTAYGHRSETNTLELNRDDVPGSDGIEVGQRLEAELSDGRDRFVRVAELTDTTLVLDTNHPLADKALTVKVTLLDRVAAGPAGTQGDPDAR